jgi:hypothetical protein
MAEMNNIKTREWAQAQMQQNVTKCNTSRRARYRNVRLALSDVPLTKGEYRGFPPLASAPQNPEANETK